MSVDDINELVRWRDKADELATLLERYSIELQQMRAEVATKTIERDEARRERNKAQAEVDRLRIELHDALDAMREQMAARVKAYAQGAAAMREACIGMACAQDLDPDAQDRMEARLLALLIPKDKP